MQLQLDEIMSQLKDYPYPWDQGPCPSNDFADSPLQSLLTVIAAAKGIQAVQYLVHSVCMRVLPLWELYCENDRPRHSIQLIGQYLHGEIEAEQLAGFIDETPSCVDDCRYSETTSASAAIAMAAAFMLDGEILTATASIENVACAFEHTTFWNEFKQWFFNVAIPVSFEKGFISLEELSFFSYDDFSKSIYKSLYGITV